MAQKLLRLALQFPFQSAQKLKDECLMLSVKRLTKNLNQREKPPQFTALLQRFLSSQIRLKSWKLVLRLLTLIAPLAKGGKAGLFAGAGVGKTVLIN